MTVAARSARSARRTNRKRKANKNNNAGNNNANSSRSSNSGRKKLIIIIAILLAALGLGIYYLVTVPHIILKGDSTMEVTMKDGYREPGATAKFSFRDISSNKKTQCRRQKSRTLRLPTGNIWARRAAERT